MEYTIFKKPPKGFHPTVEAAGCYCEYKDKILFLRREKSKPQGATWGVPAGKLEKGETPKEAVIREVFEEVGISLEEEKGNLREIGSLYIRLPHVEYVFHRFAFRFTTLPSLNLALAEHDEARWVTVEEALELPLIAGGIEALLDYSQGKSTQRK